NDLLRIALEPLPLDDVLSWVLDIASSISWLAFLPKGAIFVFDPASDDLVMKATVGLDSHVKEACARVPSGTCLCGRAAATRETVFASGMDDRHLVDHGELAPHGHYCIPILQKDAVLGILNIYVREGHQPTPGENEFLSAVANVLAGIIQRQQTEALRRTHEQIALSRGRMARVGELAAGVAHAIRNPLHGLLNSVDIFQSRMSPDDRLAIDILPLMREALQRIERVTRRLLRLTREVKVAPRSTHVAVLLGDIQRLVAGHAEQRGVVLGFEKSDVPEVVLDPERVEEALANVIGNAIDASGPGDVVTVRARFLAAPKPTLVLEVEDTGEGIPPDDLSRVLDPFFTTKPVGEGSGLGLAITKQVMEEHDGSVEIESRVDEGTLVRLSFPCPVEGPG
ncbi:MAG: GAF domain-containing sensor histidine kinase, partial [Deltaproteobacteria bacterium]|nr:GAF domain-containing sensor histidine kinase [Deltaproteobacteria bacterium]